MSRRNKSICSKTRPIDEFKPNNYENICTVPNQISKLNKCSRTLCRFPLAARTSRGSPPQAAFGCPPDVVVDGGVAPDADTCCQLLHERAHRFVLASCREPCNAQTPQDNGVDAVAVALDDLHAQRSTRVHNVSSLTRRKREEDVLSLIHI